MPRVILDWVLELLHVVTASQSRKTRRKVHYRSQRMGILYRIGLTSCNWTSYQYIFMKVFVRCSGTVRLKNLTDAPVLNKTWLWFCAPIETALYLCFLLPSILSPLPFYSLFFHSFFLFSFLFLFLSSFFSPLLSSPFFPACLDSNKSQNSTSFPSTSIASKYWTIQLKHWSDSNQTNDRFKINCPIKTPHNSRT